MMLDRLEGNEALKEEVSRMLSGRRLSHSLLLIGEQGLGAGFAARCIAADYLYPAGGPAAEALLRGECCRAEIFNTSLSAEGRAVLLYHAEKMNGESANALLKVMEEPPEGVLFLLTAQSLAGVLPTIRSRCVSFALAPAPVPQCAAFCAARGVPQKDAARLSELFEGRIGAVLAAARDAARRRQLDAAADLAKAAAAHDAYAASALLAGYEKDKAAAAVLLRDLCAYAAAGLRGSKVSPLQGEAAARVIPLATEALWQLERQVNTKIVLQVLGASL